MYCALLYVVSPPLCMYYSLTRGAKRAHETRARKPKGKLNSKEEPASKSECPPGLNVSTKVLRNDHCYCHPRKCVRKAEVKWKPGCSANSPSSSTSVLGLTSGAVLVVDRKCVTFGY